MSRRQALVGAHDGPHRKLLRLHLKLAGFAVEDSEDGTYALRRARAKRFDLILLDVLPPGLDGISLCRALRHGGANVDKPILIVTARDSEHDKVLGLECGADDYVTKSVGMRELIARVRAIMRRSAGSGPTGSRSTIQDGELKLHLESRQLIVRGVGIATTRQEFDLLFHFATHPNRVLSRTTIIHDLWPKDTYFTERMVDTVVCRLRRKIERNPRAPQIIVTARGVGYMFARADTAVASGDMRHLKQDPRPGHEAFQSEVRMD